MTSLHRYAEQLGRLDPARLAAVISLLSVELLPAVCAGVDVALRRADQQAEDLLLSHYLGGQYHRQFLFRDPTALELRRYPPNGDRDEWIEFGPAGRPQHPDEKAA